MKRYDIINIVDYKNETIEVRYYDECADSADSAELLKFSVFIKNGDDILSLHKNIQDAYTAAHESAE